MGAVTPCAANAVTSGATAIAAIASITRALQRCVTAVARLAAVPAGIAAATPVEPIAAGALEDTCVPAVAGSRAGACGCGVAEAVAGQSSCIRLCGGAIAEELGQAVAGDGAYRVNRLRDAALLGGAADLRSGPQVAGHLHRAVDAGAHLGGRGGARRGRDAGDAGVAGGLHGRRRAVDREGEPDSGTGRQDPDLLLPAHRPTPVRKAAKPVGLGRWTLSGLIRESGVN